MVVLGVAESAGVVESASSARGCGECRPVWAVGGGGEDETESCESVGGAAAWFDQEDGEQYEGRHETAKGGLGPPRPSEGCQYGDDGRPEAEGSSAAGYGCAEKEE